MESVRETERRRSTGGVGVKGSHVSTQAPACTMSDQLGFSSHGSAIASSPASTKRRTLQRLLPRLRAAGLDDAAADVDEELKSEAATG